MKTLKVIWSKYLGFFQHLLGVVGIWGPLIIAFVDSGAFGIPLDPVMIGYAVIYKDRPLMIAVCILLAGIGSVGGSLIPYWIGRKGGEPLLLKRITHRRLEELRDRYESWEFLFVMVPAMLPPPTPMKLIILAAGAFEMRVPLFALAIFAGRIVRFTLLSWLVVAYGPGIVHWMTDLFREHALSVLGAFAALALLIYLFLHRKRAV